MLKTEKIEKLTPDQELDLVNFRKEWLAVGLSTSETDEVSAKRVIAGFYKKIGKSEPSFVFVDSPVTAQLAIHTLKCGLGDSLYASLGSSLYVSLRDSLDASLYASLGDSLDASLGDSLDDSLGDSLNDSLYASLRSSLRSSLGSSLRDSLRDSLYASLRSSLGSSLRDSLRDSLYASLRDSLYASLRSSLDDSLRSSLRDSKIKLESAYLWGQMDAYWIAWYLFAEKIGVKYDPEKSKLLQDWADLSKSCGWWYPFENKVIVVRKPKFIGFDYERNVIHDDGSAAVEFYDGWKVFSLWGVRVPDWRDGR